MKLIVPFVMLCLMLSSLQAQIITPVIRANFGVDADLKANYFSGSDSTDDDWFNNGTAGPGVFIIDTTGAAALVSQYMADPTLRKKSFTRGMNYPMYSTINGKLWYDALYVRDHYKTDSTAYSTSNKNGQSPVLWQGTTTPVPDKSDINDLMVHVRRDGPSASDSLWFFAGLSLHGNTGNRYFDFELYQTDIFYNKTDGKFYNYGAEAGHTAWLFDAMGNVTRPGDVIFTAEFGSSSLTNLEARIWIDKSSLSITPTQFSWGSLFDGDGMSAQYGYANILPKTGGIFYGGNQCTNNTWAGPFGFVDVTDVFSTNYMERDFMEIAVNMTKIGLDPYNILGNSCNLSFKKVFAKTRSATSFTADLKDFVGPYSIGYPQAAVAAGDLSLFCGAGPGLIELSVSNPLATSTYTWTTPNGHIVTAPATGAVINADQAGTYIVTQTLVSGCSSYATDTLTVINETTGCIILAADDIKLKARLNQSDVTLNWTAGDKNISHFEIERSTDNKSFYAIAQTGAVGSTDYLYEVNDPVAHLGSKYIYYRLKITQLNSQVNYTRVISVKNEKAAMTGITIFPNPATDYLQVSCPANTRSDISVRIFNSLGTEIQNVNLKNAAEKIRLNKLVPGVYFIQAQSGDGHVKTTERVLITR